MAAEPVPGSVPSAAPSAPGSGAFTPLPEKPSAEFLRKLAKDRLRELRQVRSDARLFEAQLQVARDHGYSSWRALMERLNAGQRGEVVRSAQRVEIRGVAPLAWSGSDCTYLQALATVLRVIGPAHDYVRLFGDSGLAFRIRFWCNDAGTESCPSSPAGEMPPWTDFTERSIGWKVRWDVRLGKSSSDPQDMSDLLDEIRASIDAGLPVLGYARSWDMGIVYGYEESRLLIRDFYVGDAETWADITDCRGLMAFFEERQPVPTREEAARAGLAEGVSRWAHAPDRRPKGPEPGAYYYGPAAYDRWTSLLARAGELTPEQLHSLLHVSYWTYISLHDARQKAAPYLRSVAELFPSAAGLLGEAAALYHQIGKITGQVIHEGRLFPAFYQPGALERWTPELRREEIELLNQVRELDSRAAGFLRRAFETIEVPRAEGGPPAPPNSGQA